jgi:hypothetical protein
VQQALHDEAHRLASLARERTGVTFWPERGEGGARS